MNKQLGETADVYVGGCVHRLVKCICGWLGRQMDGLAGCWLSRQAYKMAGYMYVMVTWRMAGWMQSSMNGLVGRWISGCVTIWMGLL